MVWLQTMDANPPGAASKAILLNASVILFLFRALAGARTTAHRDEVSRQLLLLFREFVPCEEGIVLLANGEKELAERLRETAADYPALSNRLEEVWQRLRSDGLWASADGEMTAVPIYVGGALQGVCVLSFEADAGCHAEVLSAIASLASIAVESVREVEKLRQDNAVLEERISGVAGGIIGNSPAIRKLLERIDRLAQRETTVLIQGESGTGKELVARLLHRGSPRAAGPFIAINCAAIADSLLESELFGHEKGSFTGAGNLKKGKIEMAEGGTLFLDEIGELAAPLQAKLLRVLQQRELERVGATKTIAVDIRVVAATNRDLPQMSRNGAFREDLYHRLNVVTLRTPPLRERVEDIPVLADHFLQQFAVQCKRPGMRLSPEASACLAAYEWPGNVRELQNALEHAVVLAEEEIICPADLPETIWQAFGAPDLGAYQASVTDAKRDSILRAYEKAGGDYKGAAAQLGIHPNYLLRLVKNLGLREVIRPRTVRP